MVDGDSSALQHFNPRTSCEVRQGLLLLIAHQEDFNPRTSCEVRPISSAACSISFLISIHAPLARCDVCKRSVMTLAYDFNPRTSCEVRPAAAFNAASIFIFQSTHLLRGATTLSALTLMLLKFQSTHLLRGATSMALRSGIKVEISIHAPLARCDFSLFPRHTIFVYFNPRTSCEVRRHCPLLLSCMAYFNPRTSCEVRRRIDVRRRAIGKFQSTHLLRGATLLHFAVPTEYPYFNPRTSCEVRR